ncbi:MAG TPA: IS1182 family transposase [Candidatus Acidoferrum sp.]|nr:IS1182 family transposase [Candidatus Acidoferrum sp.]
MGIKEREFRPLPDNLSLEELVPKDNFYRRLEGRIDLSFVRELVVDRYATVGRTSIDPVVFFRLQLVMFFEGIRSERQLMEIASDRLSVRWYLGYDLHEPLPDHSSLTRIRERYGLEIFKGFFEKIVQMCFEAGLVRGEELFFDSTKVKANADIDSLASRFLVETHLSGLFERSSISEGSEIEPPSTDLDTLPTSADETLIVANARKSDWISRAGKQERSFSSGARKRTSDFRVSRTDPDATPMLMGEGEAKLGYQTHYVVDGGKARIILASLVTPYEVSENRPMLDLLWRSCFRWQIWPHHVTGDGKYGTAENVSAIEQANVRAFVGLHRSGGRPNIFGREDFTYEPKEDVYVCPAGELLQPLGKKKSEEEEREGKVTTYRATASSCKTCELRSRCTSNKLGRNLRRGPLEGYLDRVRSYAGTHPYEKALRKRKVWIEPLFGEAKDWHGMRRFRLRRLERVNIEALLIASGQNVKRLLTFGGHRPKKLAQAAALRPPVATSHEIGYMREHRSSHSWQPTRAFFNSLVPF